MRPEVGGGHEGDGGQAGDGGQHELTQPQPHPAPVSLHGAGGEGGDAGPGQQPRVSEGGAGGGVSDHPGHNNKLS